MSAGHLYVVSNPFLAPDLLKIGLTTRLPKQRAQSLSKSTSIPGAFTVEFSLPVKNCKIAERRLHLLLDDKRVDKGKEFFRVSVRDAVSSCRAIATFEEEELPVSDTLLVHPDFYFARIQPRLELPTLKALMFVLGATQHNSLFDHVIQERLLAVDGFTCAIDLAKFRKSHVRSATVVLRRLSDAALGLSYPVANGGTPMQLFDKFIYSNGHAAWIFTPSFRRLFMNPN